MSAAEMGNMFTITGAELKALLLEDEEIREQVITSAFAAWRPGRAFPGRHAGGTRRFL